MSNSKCAKETAAAEKRASRRAFAGGLGGLLGMSCVGEVADPDRSMLALSALDDGSLPPPQFVARARDIAPGAVIDFEYPAGHAAFLVQLRTPANGGIGGSGDIVAFHRACPHMGCPLSELNVERAELGPCECHLSLFDLRRGGLQIHGLASQPVAQIQLEVRGDDVYAVGVERLPYGRAIKAGA